jgi:hypothetical protein
MNIIKAFIRFYKIAVNKEKILGNRSYKDFRKRFLEVANDFIKYAVSF